tara:strand:- start:641 stop:943 length:303 start_codon:yes stop_codon:yes gene_type:complete
MKKTINFYAFEREFEQCGRGNQFTRQGLRALFNYLEEYEQDCGTEVELDVIALCCEYVEYEDLDEFHGEYDSEEFPNLETLRDYTQVIEIDDDSFIIAAF